MSAEFELKQSEIEIESLLKADARLLYENLFSTKHVGRVLDFILFESESFYSKSKDPGDLEYRIREILQLGVFNAWTQYRAGEQSRCIQVEAGWDSEKMVLSFSSLIEPEVSEFLPGKNSYATNSAEKISKFLTQIQELSDGLIVRHEKHVAKLHVIAFVNIERSEKADLQFVEFKSESDFTQSEDEHEKNSNFIPQALSQANQEAFKEEEASDAAKSKLSGVPQQSENEDGKGWVRGIIERVKTRKMEVQNKDASNENEPVLRGSIDSGLAQGEEEDSFVVKSLDSEEDKEPIVVKGEKEDLGADDTKLIVAGDPQIEDKTEVHIAADKVEHDKETLVLVDKIEADSKASEDRFNKAVEGFKQQVENGDNADSYAQGFLQDILKDRAELNRMIRETSMFVRKKEHEFSLGLASYKEQISRKDIELTRTTKALEKAKESLALTVERLGKAGDGAGSSEQTQKIEETYKKMLSTANDRLARTEQKLDDITKRFNEANSAKTKLQQEFGRQKQQLDMFAKKISDLKIQLEKAKANATTSTAIKLQAEAAAAKKAAVNETELKHKLDQSNRLITSLKDEINKAKKKCDDLQLKETQLKVELAKAQSQLKKK